MIKSLGSDLKRVISLKKMIILFTILIISYGFYITNFSIGIDALAKDRYLSGEYIAQGRVGRTIIFNALGFNKTMPFAESVTSVLLLAMAAIIFSAAYQRVATKKLSGLSIIVFQTMFVAYSLINEIFIYKEASLVIGFCYALSALVSWCIADCISKEMHFNIKNVVIILLLLTFQLSTFESFASVYLFSVFSLIWLKLSRYATDKDISGKTILKFIFIALLIMVAAVLGKYVLATLIRTAKNIPVSTSSSNQVYWFSRNFVSTLIGLVTGFIKYYFVYGFWYYPIMLYAVSCIVLFLFTVGYFNQNHKILWILVSAGILVSTVAVQIIQGGGVTKYSSCQVFCLFVAFITMVLGNLFSDYYIKSKTSGKKIAAGLGITVIIGSIWYSAIDLNNWFAVDYQRYQEEVQIMRNIDADLSDYPTDVKPVVFVGQINLSDNITKCTHVKYDEESYIRAKSVLRTIGINLDGWHGNGDFDSKVYFDKYNMANGNSCINWGVFAFREANTELHKIFEYHGYVYERPTMEEYLEANLLIPKFNAAYPKKGYIQETNDYIVVYLGGNPQLE